MDKKSVSATILVLFLALFFSVVGVCFSTFVYAKTRTLVEKVTIKTASAVKVFNDKKKTKSATQLKLSNMDVGLKPATGEVDGETKIPSTITDEGTSEGYYSTVYVDASAGFKVVVKDINIDSKHDTLLVKEERKNIFVAIKDVKGSAKSLENDEVELAQFSNTQELDKITFFVWLSSFATDELEGAKISFTIEFVLI